jgi:pantoate--beta-alanine ligase
MRACRTIEQVRAWRGQVRGTVGLVPTMGALHDGHLALVRAARRDNDQVAVSVFVNPRQFERAGDFESYPRDLERDLSLLRVEGVDVVFLPGVDEMYPPGASTTIHVSGVAERLEGAARPGHFDGVATIVTKLFNLVQPTRAYFGRKDVQQVIVVRRLVADLDIPVEIVSVETVREPSGLALSSRNALLSDDERRAAVAISEGLFAARDAFVYGERLADRLREIVRERIAAQSLLREEYVSVADRVTLQEIDGEIDSPAVLSVAVYAGFIRLIDNVTLW